MLEIVYENMSNRLQQFIGADVELENILFSVSLSKNVNSILLTDYSFDKDIKNNLNKIFQNFIQFGKIITFNFIELYNYTIIFKPYTLPINVIISEISEESGIQLNIQDLEIENNEIILYAINISLSKIEQLKFIIQKYGFIQ